MQKCCFILKTWGEPDATGQRTPPVYCGAKVGWTTPEDDDGNRYRKYNSFCDEHQRIVAAMPEDDDE
jgi:hypothetical protein